MLEFMTRRKMLVRLFVLLFLLFTAFAAWGQTYHRILTLSGTCGNSNSGVLAVYSGNAQTPTLYGVCTDVSIDGYEPAPDFGGILKVTKSGKAWTETTLSYFNGFNGAGPQSFGTFLQDANGTLYNAADGGTWGQGVVYAVYGNGVITSIYEFTGYLGGDGNWPIGGLVADAAGNLYGVTAGGGNFVSSSDCPLALLGCGVVFELVKNISTAGQVFWTESVLYAFPTDGTAGSYPVAPITLDSAGNVYGTTYYGGSSAACGSLGCGTVFKLTKPASSQTQWTASTLYEFTNGAGGSAPATGVILDSAGNLYGGTNAGGTYDAGTIYQLTPSANGYSEKTLYALNSIHGQSLEYGSKLLFDASGNLWGTAGYGGLDGSGMVFELTAKTRKYKEFHKFNDGAGGDTPYGSLTLDEKGNIWGITYNGDTFAGGTIFEITPAK